MGTVVFKNSLIEVNGTNLSSYASDVSLAYSAESLDETAMGDDTRIKKGGMFNWTIDATFHNEFQAGAVDALLFPIVGVTSCIEVRPFNTCSTAINPRYFGIGILASYPPLGGGVGSLLDTKAQWQAAGSLGRSTTAT